MYELYEMVNVCNLIGGNKNLVQGAGGNISLKLDSKRMLIKASGLGLDEVTEEKGIVGVEFDRINGFLRAGSYIETGFLDDTLSDLINKSRLDFFKLRPSMETGFHAVLGNAVVHTHPISVNLLMCMVGGQQFLKNIFGDMEFYFIEYKSPGYSLSREIAKRVDINKNGVFFLQNHGLIVSYDTLEDCVNKTNEISRKILDYLGLDEYRAESKLVYSEEIYSFLDNSDLTREFVEILKRDDSLRKMYLFPDAVVYCGEGDNFIFTKNGLVFKSTDMKKVRAIDEVMLANMYLMLTIPELGGKVNFLTEGSVNDILGMSAEKYRQKI